MRSYQNSQTVRGGLGGSNSKSKQYAQDIYSKALGKAAKVESGFQRPPKTNGWQMWSAINNTLQGADAAKQGPFEQKRPDKDYSAKYSELQELLGCSDKHMSEF